jgi:hypothetical protein
MTAILNLLVVLAASAGGGTEVEFLAMCDASGAVALSRDRFAVADDEDNVLRVYDAGRGGAPLEAVDLSPALDLPGKKKASKKQPETDLEAATRLGDRALWLTSHGRNSKGKLQPSRLRFFATTAPAAGAPAITGKPYAGLLDDLLAAPALARFGLAEAATLPPKQPGGLNIEGMTARPDGRSVLIGFRNPVPGGRALLLPLLNPLELPDGARARWGPPVQLDLGGLGVRALSYWRGRYLIIAGPMDAGPARIYTWDGKSAAARAAAVDLAGINPEGVFSPDERDQVLLLSDDGAVEVAGTPCKQLKEAGHKRFRGRWITIR